MAYGGSTSPRPWSRSYSFIAKNKNQVCPQTHKNRGFFIFFKIFTKKIGKYLHGNKNDYIFAMISEMKYRKQ